MNRNSWILSTGGTDRVTRLSSAYSQWPKIIMESREDPPMAWGLHLSMGMGFLFEKLEVYQRAVGLGEEVFRITDTFPRGHASLVDQFKRAAVSISANIAEGNGRWHSKDRRNFFLISRGSVFECVPLLELCRRRMLIEETVCRKLKEDLDALARMLTQLARGAEEKREQ